MTSVLFFVLSIPTASRRVSSRAGYTRSSRRAANLAAFRIDRTEVRFDKGEMAKIISERIESER